MLLVGNLVLGLIFIGIALACFRLILTPLVIDGWIKQLIIVIVIGVIIVWMLRSSGIIGWLNTLSI